jgi:hypothetical protein
MQRWQGLRAGRKGDEQAPERAPVRRSQELQLRAGEEAVPPAAAAQAGCCLALHSLGSRCSSRRRRRLLGRRMRLAEGALRGCQLRLQS